MSDRIPLDDLTSDQLDALYADLDRHRTAWKSARHRAALYLQSNQKLAASIDNGHASQLHALKVAQSAARDAATALSRQLDAEAALDRVRAIHSRGRLTNACNDCGQPWPCEITRALDPAQQPTTPPTHLPDGGNAEDCDACRASNKPIPYPWICPGPQQPTT